MTHRYFHTADGSRVYGAEAVAKARLLDHAQKHNLKIGRHRFWYNSHGLFISATILTGGSLSLGPFSKPHTPDSHEL